MDKNAGRSNVRIGEEALARMWPQQIVALGRWLAFLTVAALTGCFIVGAEMTYYAAGGLAIATGLVGLVAAVCGAIGVRSGPVGPRQVDHRAIRHGLSLVLAGFVLGFGVAVAVAVAIGSNWHS